MRLQLRAGIDAHRRRFGDDWRGGLWLPECAYAPWLDALLEQAGVRAACVDLTDVLEPGAHLRPLRCAAGPLLVPIDRATIELVWSRGGYPADGAYRNYHHFTQHRHRAWGNDGKPYEPERAAAAARRDAKDFVERTRERVAGGGLAVCAVDTELLGDWWHEGPLWLAAVLDEAERQGLAIARLDDALERHPPVAAPADLPRDVVGHAARPDDVERAAGRRDGLERARRRAADGRGGGRRRPARRARAARACSPATGRFSSSATSPSPTAASAPPAHRATLDAALAAPGTLDPRLRNLAPEASPGGAGRTVDAADRERSHIEVSPTHRAWRLRSG